MNTKMQTKKKPKPRAKVPPKSRTQPPAKSPATDDRPITIIGRNAAGKIVAEDRTDSNQKSATIAAAWKATGWEVEIIETGPTKR